MVGGYLTASAMDSIARIMYAGDVRLLPGVYLPGCATLLQVGIWYPSLDGDEPLWDIQTDVEALNQV